MAPCNNLFSRFFILGKHLGLFYSDKMTKKAEDIILIT